MRRSSFHFLYLLPILLLTACKYLNSSNDEGAPQVEKAENASGEMFNGIIRLTEKSQIPGLGRIGKQHITITISGKNLKRRVSSSSEEQPAYYYELIVPAEGDSVIILGVGEKEKLYYKKSKKDYLAEVAENKNRSYAGANLPYSLIFAPLPANASDYIHYTTDTADLGKLKHCHLTSIQFNTTRNCQIVYSDDVKVPVELLQYIECNQPAVVPTLALMVHYSAIEKKGGGQLEKIMNKVEKTLDEITPTEMKMESVNFSHPSEQDFKIPVGFKQVANDDEFDSLLNPEPPSSGNGHHHHHWD